MFAIEFGLLVVALLLACIAPRPWMAGLRRLEEPFVRLARRQWLSVFAIAAVELVLRAALLPILPIPVPGVHDEYSYLLQADTFAHGRITNPTPPLWTHFATFHIIFQPTYASKFPPVQGLILALGQVAFGHPWFGVWISVAAMCAAICWMLQGWLPPGWALLGGFLAIIRLGTFSYWINSYWGGAAAAFAGALVLGALARVIRQRKLGYIWAMGVGFALLANTRPYEGLLLSLPVIVILFAWIARQPRAATVEIARAATPIVTCMFLTVVAMSYYNWRIDGNPVRMPYQVYMSQYDVSPLFLWQKPTARIPSYPEPYMRDFYVSFEMAPYVAAHATLRGFLREMYLKIKTYDWFYLGPILTFPFIALPWVLRDRRTRPLVWIGLVMLAGLLAETWSLPHYAAPATALLYALFLQCLRHLRVAKFRRKRVGIMIASTVPVICVIMLCVRVAQGSDSHWTWYSDWPGNKARAEIIHKLDNISGRQLVIVRYSPRHSFQEEWVFNDADISKEHIVWARDEGSAANAALIHAYSDSRVWLLQPDQTPPKLSAYPASPVLAAGVPRLQAVSAPQSDPVPNGNHK